MTVLVREVKYYELSSEHLRVLLSFCESDLLDFTRQSTAFSVLKVSQCVCLCVCVCMHIHECRLAHACVCTYMCGVILFSHFVVSLYMYMVATI